MKSLLTATILCLTFIGITCILIRAPARAQSLTLTPEIATSISPIANDAPSVITETFELDEGSATTTSFGVGIDILMPKTASTGERPSAPTPLFVEIKMLVPSAMPPAAWASTTTSTVWQIDIPGEVNGYWMPNLPIKITLPAPRPHYYKKIIHFWDDNTFSWRPLPSTTDFARDAVWALYPLPFGRFIVRDHTAIFEGMASWYRWKNGHFAAFRFLPKKSKLKVTNISSSTRRNKSVEIIVNDYGPEAWTERLIDLDYHAYWHIGLPRGGLMPVRVEILNPKL